MLSCNQAGVGIFKEKGSDKVLLEVYLVQCVHCGGHFPPLPSKGRGYCGRCNGPICGKDCLTCVPQEQYLENWEKGRPLDYRPIVG